MTDFVMNKHMHYKFFQDQVNYHIVQRGILNELYHKTIIIL